MIRAAFILFILGLSIATYQSNRFVELWLTPDQYGSLLYKNENYIAAARSFDNIHSRGLSYYAAEDFISATNTFKQLDTAAAFFYLGNAYAQQEMLAEAISAYDEALIRQPEFSAAQFNRNWVNGLKELDDAVYEDAGGTGGQLEADEIVFDDRAENAIGEMNEQEMRAQGMSDQQIEQLWMRRVQTTPGDFLALKFSYQAGAQR